MYKIIFLSVFSILWSLSALSQNPKFNWQSELENLKRVDKLPAYRSNLLVEQESSYDRTGGNNDGFNGTYSFIRKENGKLVVADLKGPGVINRIWTPTPTQDTLFFYFDGEDTPGLTIKFMDLFSGEVYPFVKPVCGNEIGGYYCYIPIPYKKSCKIVFSGERILFHQIQYRSLSGFDVETFNMNFSESDKKILDEVCSLWSDNSPSVKSYSDGLSSGYVSEEKVVVIRPGEEITFFESDKPGRIVGFEIDGGTAFDGTYKDIILSARWDGEEVEAIYAPLADFFGYAYGHGAMRSILLGKNGNANYCYLPMPFDKAAKLQLVYKKRDQVTQAPISVKTRVHYNSINRNIKDEGKFYSVWKREQPKEGEYYTFLDVKAKGHYVGTVHIAQGFRPGMTLFFEGDDSTFVDGKMRSHGTGSEDYYNGGWYALLDRWDRGVSLPIHGSLDYSLPMNRTGGYRFFLSDKMTFEKEMYHGMEHGPQGNEFPVDYTSVAYFYADRPLSGRMEPKDNLREVYYPTEHIYFPQLMELTIGSGQDIWVNNKRGVQMETQNQGMVRVRLSDVPEGKYKLLISYFEKPNGGEFCIWQRQKQLTKWQSANNGKEVFKERQYVGDIELTSQTNSVTFHVRKDDKGNQFELDRIFLQKLE